MKPNKNNFKLSKTVVKTFDEKIEEQKRRDAARIALAKVGIYITAY